MQEAKYASKTTTQAHKMKKRKATCLPFVPRSMNYIAVFDSNHSSSSSPCYPSSSSCSWSARTFTNSDKRGARHPHASAVQPPCSMSSLTALLPESPSPICSHGSIPPATRTCQSELCFSETATEFSTPRKQSFGIACNDNNLSTCFSEIDEWLEHANKFCKSSNFQTNHLTAICKTFLTAPDDALHAITLPSVREESPVYQSHSRLACINSIYGASKSGSNERQKLISRPKPYDAFLNEVRRQKQTAERDARKKAKRVELMHRMKRKEDAINGWELEKTRKAMDEMEKFQNDLERKQIMASTRTRKKISLVKKKADKLRLNLRRSIMRRFEQLQISETHTPGEIPWGSRLPFC